MSHTNPCICNSGLGPANPVGSALGRAGEELTWGIMAELSGGDGNILYFDYGISCAGRHTDQYLAHAKWLHFIVCKLYHNKVAF